MKCAGSQLLVLVLKNLRDLFYSVHVHTLLSETDNNPFLNDSRAEGMTLISRTEGMTLEKTYGHSQRKNVARSGG